MYLNSFYSVRLVTEKQFGLGGKHRAGRETQVLVLCSLMCCALWGQAVNF